jgi:hypothetical protein
MSTNPVACAMRTIQRHSEPRSKGNTGHQIQSHFRLHNPMKRRINPERQLKVGSVRYAHDEYRVRAHSAHYAC